MRRIRHFCDLLEKIGRGRDLLSDTPYFHVRYTRRWSSCKVTLVNVTGKVLIAQLPVNPIKRQAIMILRRRLQVSVVQEFCNVLMRHETSAVQRLDEPSVPLDVRRNGYLRV
jgi:hypothetical protein